MAILRQQNWLSQQRVDIPHLRSLESGVAADFDVASGRLLASSQAVVIRGFTLTNLGTNVLATALQLSTADGIVCNVQASEAGSLLWVPSDRAVEALNPSTNSKVSGSWTAGQVNYVGLDFVRTADTSTTDLVQFLDSDTLLETPRQVPLARTLDYRIVIGTLPFSSQPNLVPVAILTLNSSSQVTAAQDARPLLFRLGSGGDSPSASFSYPWPDGRKESTALTSALFTGGDKAIRSQRDWMQAVMTRAWESGGGEYWYSATADRNLNLVWTGATFSNGENFTWDGTHLLWKGLRFIFDNSTGHFNDVQRQEGSSPGLTNLADGDCLYVDLDRSKNTANQWVTGRSTEIGEAAYNASKAYTATTAGTTGATPPTHTSGSVSDGGVTWKYVSGNAGDGTAPAAAAPVPVKVALTTMGAGMPPGSRQVLAWRVGDKVFTRNWRYAVGTTFIPATDTSLGVVKLSRAASTPAQPIVISDRGGTIAAATATQYGLQATGNTTGAGLWGVGGATGPGVIGQAGGGNANGGQFTGAGTGAGTYANTFAGGPAGKFEATAGGGHGVEATGNGAGKAFKGLGGDVEVPAANKYTFAAARSRVYHVPAADIRAANYGAGGYGGEIFRDDGNGFGPLYFRARVPAGNFQKFVAPVHLPHGATATSIKVQWATDGMQTNSLAGVYLELIRNTASGTSTKFSGTRTTTQADGDREDSYTISHVVDNTGRGQYQLKLDVDLWMKSFSFVDMDEKRTHSAAVTLLNGQLMSCGGLDSGGTYQTATVWFDTHKQLLTSKAVLPAARAFHDAKRLSSGNVLVFGGLGAAGAQITSILVYDPIADTYTAGAGTKDIFEHASAVQEATSGVFVTGGRTQASSTAVTTVDFITAAGGLTGATAMNVARKLHAVAWILRSDGAAYLLAVGGTGSGGTTVATTEYVDAGGATWTNAASMSTARENHSATTLPNGKVLVVGGNTTAGSPATATTSCEMYDPIANTWAAAASLPESRTEHAAFLLPDGKVVVIGGRGDGKDKVHLYDTGTDTWTTLANGDFPASYFSAHDTPTRSAAMAPDGTVVEFSNGLAVGSGGAQIQVWDPISGRVNRARYHPMVRIYGLEVGYDYTEVLPEH